jgi:hypothetical protein
MVLRAVQLQRKCSLLQATLPLEVLDELYNIEPRNWRVAKQGSDEKYERPNVKRTKNAQRHRQLSWW